MRSGEVGDKLVERAMLVTGGNLGGFEQPRRALVQTAFTTGNPVGLAREYNGSPSRTFAEGTFRFGLGRKW
jgi:hypothetical protein